jgi:hypothetical protein
MASFSLERSRQRLVRKIYAVLKEFALDEDRAQAASKILLDKRTFSYLKGAVSLRALKRIDVD